MDGRDDLLDDSFAKLQRLQHLSVVQAICIICSWYVRRKRQLSDSRFQLTHEIRLHSERRRDEFLEYLFSSNLCRNMIRMSASAFMRLCHLLVRDGGLKPTTRVTVEEQVAKILYLFGHNVTHRELQFFFQRSGETISRHFHNVLEAIIELEDKFIRQPDGSTIPSEIYTSRSGLITPYRGVKYHLKEYSRNPPKNHQELFNLRHASLRNAIERTFGVQKKRFPIVASSTEPNYVVKTQIKIILACCILHNYLMGVDPDEKILAEVDRELLNRRDLDDNNGNNDENNDETRRGEILRDSIATSMWTNYV